MYMPFYYDPTFILVIIGMVISMLASNYIKSTYRKYEKVSNRKGYHASDVARMILQQSDIDNVGVTRISGDLTDNYNSHTKVLSLSDRVSESRSVAAIGVAAHECGHAIQDKENYGPLRLRGALVPVVNFGATLSIPLILVGGLFFGSSSLLINLGIWCFALTFIFQVVTLPVEFNASRRALAVLSEGNMLDPDELSMARKVLIAAALTYVAAAITSLLQLVRLILIFGKRRD